MNKDRYAEFDWHRQDRQSNTFREPDWFDHLQADACRKIAMERLKARKARQATRVAPTSFQCLLALFKRLLGAST